MANRTGRKIMEMLKGMYHLVKNNLKSKPILISCQEINISIPKLSD
jgi:hypothetical protein